MTTYSHHCPRCDRDLIPEHALKRPNGVFCYYCGGTCDPIQPTTKGGDETCADSHALLTAGAQSGNHVPIVQQAVTQASVSNPAAVESNPPGDAGKPRRKIVTEHVRPPIPTRAHDWRAWYDGQEEGPYGSGATEHEAIEDLFAVDLICNTGTPTPATDTPRVFHGIIIPDGPPLNVTQALQSFVDAVEGYNSTGVWPDNYTFRKLADEGAEALKHPIRAIELQRELTALRSENEQLRKDGLDFARQLQDKCAENEGLRKERDAAMTRANDLERTVPDVCPITRQQFFMFIADENGIMRATYGGPFDSYTIPEMEGEATQPWHERELCWRRYDHDEGAWKEGVETIPMRVISEEVLSDLTDAKEELTASLATVAQLREALEDCASPINYLQREADKEGVKLNGGVAIQFSKDAEFIKGIARAALTTPAPAVVPVAKVLPVVKELIAAQDEFDSCAGALEAMQIDGRNSQQTREYFRAAKTRWINSRNAANSLLSALTPRDERMTL